MTDTTTTRHLCGHLPLVETPETLTTYCVKCVAWGCTTPNCPGHMRMPEQAQS